MLITNISNVTNPSLTRNRDLMHNAYLAILDGVAAKIIKQKSKVGRGKVNWCYYETASGKRRATFLSPKEFVGYKWLHNYSVVVNLETGAKYQVTDESCTCPYWFYAVRTGKQKACKHQNMRSEFVSQSLAEAIGIIDPDNPPEGCILKRTDDWLQIEYEVFVWHKDYPKDTPYLKKLGRVVQEAHGIWTCGSKSATGQLYKKIKDSLAFLLNYHGIKYSQVLEALESRKASKSKKATQPSPYGVCHQCGSNYDIPGADDANHCPQCGWVEPPLSTVSPKQQGLVAATTPEAFDDFFLAS